MIPVRAAAARNTSSAAARMADSAEGSLIKGLAAALLVGQRQIPLALVRNPRARRYVLRLRPDGVARVTIPRGGSVHAAKEFAERHTAWLARQLQRLETRPVRPAAWTLGSEVLFRGELVRLEAGVDGTAATIRLGGESFQISGYASENSTWGSTGDPPVPPGDSPDGMSSTPGVNNDGLSERRPSAFPIGGPPTVAGELPRESPAQDLRPAVERCLRRLAERELPPRVFELASRHDLIVRRVTVRNQRTRWGSCSRRGSLSLNWRLVQTPAFVSDYIILHELMHLCEMNHSRRFWREVARVCPEFTEAERWLKRHSSLLRM